jgi:hypothetical protein
MTLETKQGQRTGVTICSGSWIIVIDLNLDTTLGSELGHNNRISNLLENGRICFASQTIIEGVKVGSSNNKVKVNWL